MTLSFLNPKFYVFFYNFISFRWAFFLINLNQYLILNIEVITVLKERWKLFIDIYFKYLR